MKRDERNIVVLYQEFHNFPEMMGSFDVTYWKKCLMELNKQFQVHEEFAGNGLEVLIIVIYCHGILHLGFLEC
jgi:hypothetical protein